MKGIGNKKVSQLTLFEDRNTMKSAGKKNPKGENKSHHSDKNKNQFECTKDAISCIIDLEAPELPDTEDTVDIVVDADTVVDTITVTEDSTNENMTRERSNSSRECFVSKDQIVSRDLERDIELSVENIKSEADDEAEKEKDVSYINIDSYLYPSSPKHEFIGALPFKNVQQLPIAKVFAGFDTKYSSVEKYEKQLSDFAKELYSLNRKFLIKLLWLSPGFDGIEEEVYKELKKIQRAKREVGEKLVKFWKGENMKKESEKNGFLEKDKVRIKDVREKKILAENLESECGKGGSRSKEFSLEESRFGSPWHGIGYLSTEQSFLPHLLRYVLIRSEVMKLFKDNVYDEKKSYLYELFNYMRELENGNEVSKDLVKFVNETAKLEVLTRLLLDFWNFLLMTGDSSVHEEMLKFIKIYSYALLTRFELYYFVFRLFLTELEYIFKNYRASGVLFRNERKEKLFELIKKRFGFGEWQDSLISELNRNDAFRRLVQYLQPVDVNLLFLVSDDGEDNTEDFLMAMKLSEHWMYVSQLKWYPRKSDYEKIMIPIKDSQGVHVELKSKILKAFTEMVSFLKLAKNNFSINEFISTYENYLSEFVYLFPYPENFDEFKRFFEYWENSILGLLNCVAETKGFMPGTGFVRKNVGDLLDKIVEPFGTNEDWKLPFKYTYGKGDEEFLEKMRDLLKLFFRNISGRNLQSIEREQNENVDIFKFVEFYSPEPFGTGTDNSNWLLGFKEKKIYASRYLPIIFDMAELESSGINWPPLKGVLEKTMTKILDEEMKRSQRRKKSLQKKGERSQVRQFPEYLQVHNVLPIRYSLRKEKPVKLLAPEVSYRHCPFLFWENVDKDRVEDIDGAKFLSFLLDFGTFIEAVKDINRELEEYYQLGGTGRKEPEVIQELRKIKEKAKQEGKWNEYKFCFGSCFRIAPTFYFPDVYADEEGTSSENDDNRLPPGTRGARPIWHIIRLLLNIGYIPAQTISRKSVEEILKELSKNSKIASIVTATFKNILVSMMKSDKIIVFKAYKGKEWNVKKPDGEDIKRAEIYVLFERDSVETYEGGSHKIYEVYRTTVYKVGNEVFLYLEKMNIAPVLLFGSRDLISDERGFVNLFTKIILDRLEYKGKDYKHPEDFTIIGVSGSVDSPLRALLVEIEDRLREKLRQQDKSSITVSNVFSLMLETKCPVLKEGLDEYHLAYSNFIPGTERMSERQKMNRAEQLDLKNAYFLKDSSGEFFKQMGIVDDNVVARFLMEKGGKYGVIMFRAPLPNKNLLFKKKRRGSEQDSSNPSTEQVDIPYSSNSVWVFLTDKSFEQDRARQILCQLGLFGWLSFQNEAAMFNYSKVKEFKKKVGFTELKRQKKWAVIYRLHPSVLAIELAALINAKYLRGFVREERERG